MAQVTWTYNIQQQQQQQNLKPKWGGLYES